MTISGPSALHSTEKAETRPESPLSADSINKIVSTWDDVLDGAIDPEKIVPREWRWSWPVWLRPKQRLTKTEANIVQTYINAITRNDYPFQIREYMGRHLWLEFCEYYAVNPDLEKAMRYL